MLLNLLSCDWYLTFRDGASFQDSPDDESNNRSQPAMPFLAEANTHQTKQNKKEERAKRKKKKKRKENKNKYFRHEHDSNMRPRRELISSQSP